MASYTMSTYAMSTHALSASQCPIPSTGIMDSLVSVLLKSLLVAQCSISPKEDVPTDYAAEALAYGLETFDFIVIGSGTAGSVVASRLSENPNWSVLLMEIGGDPAQESEIPGLAPVVSLSDKTFHYYTEPSERYCKAYNTNRCYWPQGKSIGGSSEQNDMIYAAGNRRDYDRWCAEGSTGWCFDDLKPYFEKSVTPVDNATNLSVDFFTGMEFAYISLLFDAAVELGQNDLEEIKEGSYLGYTAHKGTVAEGRRVSVAKAYLGKVARRRPNLKVIKNAQVTKLHFSSSGQQVTAVEFLLQNKYILRLKVGKEVILSAGAIDTPKLLMLSGVGPRKALYNVGIPVVHDLPVGENLQDHVRISVFVGLDNSNEVTDKENLDNLYEYLLHQGGSLAGVGVRNVVGYISSDTNPDKAVYPDMQIGHEIFNRGSISLMETHLNALYLKDEYKKHLLNILRKKDILVLSVALLNPESRGTIKLKSSVVFTDPAIDANYMDSREDTATLVEGMSYVEAFVESAALQECNAAIIRMPLKDCDALAYKTEPYWRCYMTYFSSTAFQPASTAKMGSFDDKTTVVTPSLKVKGVHNLRVADASIMPRIPSSKTTGTTVMIGEKAASLIKEDWKSY